MEQGRNERGTMEPGAMLVLPAITTYERELKSCPTTFYLDVTARIPADELNALLHAFYCAPGARRCSDLAVLVESHARKAIERRAGAQS
jgi:hypothetical protein